MVSIEFDMIVLKEEKNFVAYSPELDVSSCGDTVEEAKANLKTAVRLFIEEAEKMGTLEDILTEAGYRKHAANKWTAPRMVATESVEVS